MSGDTQNIETKLRFRRLSLLILFPIQMISKFPSHGDGFVSFVPAVVESFFVIKTLNTNETFSSEKKLTVIRSELKISH